MKKRSNFSGFVGLLALVLLAVPFGSEVRAQDVVFNEGTIQGDVRIGTEPLTRVRVEIRDRQTGEILSTSPFLPDIADPGTVSHALPINVPADGSRELRVRVSSVQLASGQRFDFPTRNLTIFDGTPLVADFIETDIAFIGGQINIVGVDGTPAPELFQGAWIGFGGNGYFYSRNLAANSDATYSFVVAPGTVSLLNGGCCCQVSLDDSASNDTIQVRIALTLAQQGLAIGAGETLIVDVSVNAPRTGAITATADMPGAAPQFFHNGWVLGNGVDAGRSFDPGETFERGALAEGNYSFQVTTRLNDRADIFTHPHASMSSSRQSSPSRFDVVAGEATHITVTTPQATLSGSYVLSGSVSNNDLASSSNVSRADAVGVDTLALGGISSEFAPADGSLDLIVGPGTWRMNLLRMFLRRENDSPPLDGRMVLRFTANGAPRAENLVAGQILSSPSSSSRLVVSPSISRPWAARPSASPGSTGPVQTVMPAATLPFRSIPSGRTWRLRTRPQPRSS